LCIYILFVILSAIGFYRQQQESNLKHMQKQKKKRTQKKPLNKAVSQLAKQIKQQQ